MAFGFTPKFEAHSSLNGLNPQQYIVVALEAAKELDWDIAYISKTGFLAIKRSLWSNSFELKVTIDEQNVLLKSTSLGRGMYDWNKNEDNVNALEDKIESTKTGLTIEQLDEKVAAMNDTFHSEEVDQLTLPPPTVADNAKSFISIFFPRQGYAVTPIIVNLNILIFILMVLQALVSSCQITRSY